MTALPAGLRAPAQCALAEADIGSLEDVAAWRRTHLAALHGIGPKALRILDAVFLEAGLPPLA